MANSASTTSPSKWYAEQSGWLLGPGNVMVEGTSDVAYFHLASRLHLQKTGMRLLDENISVFASGLEDEGGAYGIQDRFPTLFNLVRLERDADGKVIFRVISLFDDDDVGRTSKNIMLNGNRLLKEYESVFLLRREMPLRIIPPAELGKSTEQQNIQFGKENCVIEDMLSDGLCNNFLAFAKNVLARPMSSNGPNLHRPWNMAGKAQLREFADKTATWSDVERLVNALRALRSYLGLSPDGTPG